MDIYLIAIIAIVVVILANLIAFLGLRGMRGTKINWLSITRDSIKQPFKKEDNQLSALRQRVEELSESESVEQESVDE